MDMNERLILSTNSLEWTSSPSQKVMRKQLEREKEESGHVTSVVKYLENSNFKSHYHPLGEEIFVLSGTFSDESGDYPSGTYLRNPPGSHHSPFSEKGCVLFVKLNQFEPGDKQQVTIKTNKEVWHKGQGNLMVLPLHSYKGESTALVKWPKGEKFSPHRHFGGEEVFVLSGTFKDEHGSYPRGTWLRNPHLSKHCPWVEEETIIFVKTGHLNR